MKYIYDYILFEKITTGVKSEKEKIEWRADTKPLTTQATLKILRENCKKFDPTNGYITRDVPALLSTQKRMFLIDPKKLDRVSRDNPNIYTLIMDNNIRWKGYPKRKNSLICTYQNNFPSSWKETFVVVPFDNAKFGVCSSSDIWHDWRDILVSFEISMSVDEFLKKLEFVHTIINRKLDISKIPYIEYYNNVPFTNDYDKIEEEINAVDQFILDNVEALKTISQNTWVDKQFQKLYEICKEFGLWKFLTEELFTPYSFKNWRQDSHKFTKMSAYSLFKKKLKESTELEIWTDSPCLLIDRNKFLYLNKKYKLGYPILDL